MAVLKVNVGDAVTPDWRNIGCGTVAGSDLVPNGDFETDVSGWAADDTVGGPSTFARSTAWSSTGAASFEATGFGGNGSWFKSTAYIPVTANAGYDLAGVFKRIGGTTISGWHFGLAFYTDTSGTHVSGPQWEFDTGPSGSISDGAIGGPLTAPADAAYARVFFRAIGTAALYYIDAIMLVQTSSPGRLKLWDGTRWMREVCDDDLTSGTYPVASNTATIYFDLSTFTIYGYGHNVPSGTTVLNVDINGHDYYLDLISGTAGSDCLFSTNMDFGVPIAANLTGLTINYIRARTSLLVFLGAVTSTASTVIGLAERHPLKVNVGTPSVPDWQTVACMTPA